MTVDDAQRARVRAELPEVELIEDAELQARVVEAWALALSQSSFSAVSDIRGSGNPDTPPLEDGTQTDHIRGVTRLAVAIADELGGNFPGLDIDRDLLVAAALCHDVGKPWEFDPENQAPLGSAARPNRPALDTAPRLRRTHLPDGRPARGSGPRRRRALRRR